MSAQVRSVPAAEDPSITREIRVSPHQEVPTTTRATPHPRWLLHLEARMWRILGQVGFWFNGIAAPPSRPPSFTREFVTTGIGDKETSKLELAFYVPEAYELQVQRGKRYPVVVNLHGGGFTMGSAKDDGRWAAMVLEQVDSIFISVEYRLAPKFPFPTAVEDGTEALLHLTANAEAFGIDTQKMALSGFSAGANLSFAIPLRLQTHLQSIKNEFESKAFQASIPTPILPRLVSIVAWYPNVDNRLTRDERRAASVRPDQTLPPILTNLFDESYMPNLDDRLSPYASPAAASDEALVTALPDNIVMFLCGWDMLLQEGEVFAKRLKELGKTTHCVTIPEKRHGFDKAPNPITLDPDVVRHYTEACGILRKAFGQAEHVSADQINPAQ